MVQEKVCGRRGLPRRGHRQRHPLAERLASLLDGRPVLESTARTVSAPAGSAVRELPAAASAAGQVRGARAAGVLRRLIVLLLVGLVVTAVVMAVEALVAGAPPAPPQRVVLVSRRLLLLVLVIVTPRAWRTTAVAVSRPVAGVAATVLGFRRRDSSARRGGSARGAVSPGRERRYLTRRLLPLLLLLLLVSTFSRGARRVESHDVSTGEQVSEHLLIVFVVVAPALIRGKGRRRLLHAPPWARGRQIDGVR